MDNQKVTQVLKQIFDKNGGQIIQNKSNFKAAVFDLLDELHYKDERTVLKYAIDCNAIPTLLSVPQITGDAVEQAVNEIQRECHMAKEDAEFVVGCVVAACGGNLEVVTENARKQKAEHGQKEAEEQAHQREERKSVSHSGKRKYMGIAIGMAVCMALFVLIGIISGEGDMFWFVVATGILLLGLVFFLLGRKLVLKDRELNRKSMSGKTRICYALGFISAALASYTIYFWFEDYLFEDASWNTIVVIFGICIIIAILFILSALYCLVVGRIRYPNEMRSAVNHVDN